MRVARRLLGRKEFRQPPFWLNEDQAFRLGRSMSSNREWIEHNFDAYVKDYYKDNGVVFAVILTRMLVFSEALFRWQRMVEGRPGELFTSPELEILDRPGPGETTGSLLVRMEQDASLAGNSYQTFADDEGNIGKSTNPATRRIVRMRPDQVEIIIYSPSGNPWGVDARKAGFLFHPAFAADSVILTSDEVAHYAPVPDPSARFRGMSWLTPIVREIVADREALEHKKIFFKNGATLGNVVSFKETVSQDDFDEFVEKFNAQHRGTENAYNTLFLGGGADVTALGTDFRQLEFAKTQGQGETRIAAAGGVPPVIVGLSEGLQAATYSNYGQARRRLADGTMSPLWRMAAQALATLVKPPEQHVRLWYDARDIPFLREDLKDVAEITQLRASAINTLTIAGFNPDSIVNAVDSGDVTRLVHSGMTSVQLFKPGQEPPPKADPNADPEKPPKPDGQPKPGDSGGGK